MTVAFFPGDPPIGITCNFEKRQIIWSISPNFGGVNFLYAPPDTIGKSIVGVPICSGMGATNFKFWVLSR